MGKGAETNADPAVEDGKCSWARDAFAGSRPAPLPAPVTPDAPLLLLRRRTWISVACELLRASVKHARHLAEDVCDSSSAAAGAGAGAVAISDGDGGCFEYGNRAKGVLTVEIANRERWGGSTDGIADTSGSDSGRQASKTSTACAKDESRPGSTAESGTAGRAKVDGNVAAGEAATAPARAVEEKDPSVLKATAAALRVVGSTLELARETPPFLVRSLAALAGEGAMLPESDGERGDVGEAVQGRHAATASRDECLSAPDAIAGVSAPLAADEAVAMAPHRQPWVFTGVIEALVLAESFRATTVLHGFSSPTEKRSGNSNDSDCGRQQLSATSSSGAPSSSFARTAEAGTDAGEDGGGGNRPSSGGHHPSHTAAERKNSPSATTSRPPTTGGDDDPQQHFLLVERQLEMLHREAFPPANTDDDDDGLSIPTATFVLPFSWGSMSLLNATAPARLAEKKGRGGVDDDGRHDHLQDLQSLRRRAAQLDRLLSARIVCALPGYVMSLPPRRCIGIIPTLLRWLEVGEADTFV